MPSQRACAAYCRNPFPREGLPKVGRTLHMSACQHASVARDSSRHHTSCTQMQEAHAKCLQLEAELAVRDGMLQQYEREREIARARGYDFCEVGLFFGIEVESVCLQHTRTRTHVHMHAGCTTLPFLVMHC